MVEIRSYIDERGRKPFDEWLSALRDRRAAARVLARLARLENALEGDAKSVGDEIRERRIPEGKGYRVYYAWDGEVIVILLCGGSKASQQSDIERAKRYWRHYHDQ